MPVSKRSITSAKHQVSKILCLVSPKCLSPSYCDIANITKFFYSRKILTAVTVIVWSHNINNIFHKESVHKAFHGSQRIRSRFLNTHTCGMIISKMIAKIIFLNVPIIRQCKTHDNPYSIFATITSTQLKLSNFNGKL